MDNKKIFKILEYLWLFTAGLSVFITVYFMVIGDRDAAIYFFFVFLIGHVPYQALPETKTGGARAIQPSQKEALNPKITFSHFPDLYCH
jgi:hypothetical protein